MLTSRRPDPALRRGPRFPRSEPPGSAGPALLAGETAEPTAIPLGWTRVGRSPRADIRLEDPSVSRRHALIVRDGDDRLQVIDDRSLTSVHVNGRRVGWAELRDGDELRIGRVRMIVATGSAGRRSVA